MADLADGESVEIKGSARTPYIVKNVGGVYSCTCPAWRNQSLPIDRRTCKHLRQLRGEQAEQERIGGTALPTAAQSKQRAAAAPQKEMESTAPPVLLAHAWDNQQDLAGWWLSEKLDGVRAWWTGNGFVSRQGNVFYAPDWFIEGLPEVPLDGELWIDRKAFQRTVSIVRRQDGGEHWRTVRFVIFDAPAVSGPFEQRLEAIRQLVDPQRAGYARLVDQVLCRGLDHVREELARVEALGGEGLMLRQPGSLYEAGRSPTLLKVKRFHDAEAIVVEHLPGSGRHRGRLGALLVQRPDGTRFSVGTGFTDAQRNNPPPVGSVITYRYQELTDAGVPRFPTFVRCRTDAAKPTSA